jgi:hypothetical protein
LFYIYSMNEFSSIPTDADFRRDSERSEHRAAMLDDLSKIGVALAEELKSLAGAQARLAEAVVGRLRSSRPDGVAALGELAVLLHQGNVDFAQMYERIARSVRRCIAMEMQIAAARPPWARAASGERNGAAARAPAAGTSSGSADESDGKTRLDRGPAAELAGELGAESLLSDLHDRPEDLTGIADLGLDRPLKELIAEICADFGVDGEVWAERLGLGDEMADGAGTATGKSRTDARRNRPGGKDRAETPPRSGPSALGPVVPPNRPFAAEEPDRRPPHRIAAADPGRPGGLNRQQRRAAARRQPRRAPPSMPDDAVSRLAKNGCDPP